MSVSTLFDVVELLLLLESLLDGDVVFCIFTSSKFVVFKSSSNNFRLDGDLGETTVEETDEDDDEDVVIACVTAKSSKLSEHLGDDLFLNDLNFSLLSFCIFTLQHF